MFYFEERHDRDIRLAQRLAFFATADILLMTATRYVYTTCVYVYVQFQKLY